MTPTERAERAARIAARQAEMAARLAAREARVAAREEKKDERAETAFRKCVQKTLPAVRQQMRDNCIANPGGQACKDLLQGKYPRCLPVSYLRGKPPTPEEISCGANHSSCLENLLPKFISEQAARCEADPAGQDCKDIALKRYMRCAECGE